MPIDTAASLLDALVQNKLLEPAQLDEAKSLRGRFSDPRALAKEMIQRGWLTPFQVNQILANRPGDLLLGNYVILERLGEGGMGQVFKARNWKLGRVVAIKVIRKERLANPQALERFRREIRAASQLGHPNVVTAYDADTIGDTQLFAMEYVDGIDLSKLVKEKGPLPVARACDYIRQAALGLQHASEKGLVHRDIKPNNLVVTKDAKGNHVVKLLDMGLARVIETEDTTLTKEGSVMGTPDYIAPEQARDAHKADIRADLYSLGCTFFFVLTGQVPFQGGSLTEKLLKHHIEPPPPVQKIRPEVPPGVAAIVHKLMEKKPADRYQAPFELADAISEVVGPDGKFTAKAKQGGIVIPKGLKKKAKTRAEGGGKSRRLVVLAAGVLGLAAVAVVGMNLLGGNTADTPPTTNTELAKGKTTPSLPTTQVTASKATTTKATETKKKDPEPKGTQPPLDNLRAEAIWADERVATLPGEAVAVLGEHRGRHYGGPVPGLTFSPDGKTLASAGPDGARIWNAADMKQIAHLKVAGGYAVAYSADGQLLAVSDVSGSVQVYDTARLTADPIVLKAEPPVLGPAYGLAFAPESRTLAIARSPAPQGGKLADTESAISIWDLSGEQPQRQTVMRGHRGPIFALAFSPDGQLLASAGRDGSARLWDAASGKARGTLTGHSSGIRGLAFGPQGKWLFTGSDDGTIRAWDTATGKQNPSQAPINTGSSVIALTVARQGMPHLLAGQFDGRVTIYQWAKQSLKPVGSLSDSTSVTAVAVDPRRSMIAAATMYGTVRIWDWRNENEISERPPPKGHLASVLSLDFTPEGASLVSGSLDGSVKMWDMVGPTPQERDLRANLGGMSSVAVPADGKRLAAIGQLGQLRIWDLPGASIASDLQSGAKNRFNYPGGVAFSPDSRLLAATDSDPRVIRIWGLRTGGPPQPQANLPGHEGQVSSLAFAPDGELLASASGADGTVRVWNISSRQVVKQYEITRNQLLTSLAFSPTGLLAFGTANNGIVNVCDPKAGNPPRQLRGHRDVAWSVAFAPVGDLLASGGEEGKLILWEAATGRKLREWQLAGPALALRFSPDARYLAVGNANGTIYILRLEK